MGDPHPSPDAHSGRPRRKGNPLANLKLTALLIGLLVPVLIADAQGLWQTIVPRALLLALLGINLLAVLAERWHSFVKKPPLLIFHIGMASLVILSAAGRMVHYESLLVLAEGQSQGLMDAKHSLGPWAPTYLADLSVGLKSVETRFHGRGLVQDSQAQLVFLDPPYQQLGMAAPNHPAQYRGLRVYQTAMRGFSAIFSYQESTSQRPQLGSVKFPEYKRFADEQVEDLLIPGLEQLMTLRIEGIDLRQEGTPWDFVVPDSLRIRVAGDSRSALLAPGQDMELENGTLRLESVQRWATLSLVYDPYERIILFLAMGLGICLAVYYLTSQRHSRSRTS